MHLHIGGLTYLTILSYLAILPCFVQSFYTPSNSFVKTQSCTNHNKEFRLIINMSQNNNNQMEYLHSTQYPDDDYSHILGYGLADHKMSKLQQISRDRINDVILSKAPIDTQGCAIDRSFYVSAEDLEEEMKEFEAVNGPPRNIYQFILSKAPKMTIAAEFKRASPSKGDLNLNVNIIDQCLEYANIGATIISVLTECKHFKGTLSDMKSVRLATQQALGASDRPAILRKDFLFDRYHILEARANGADTVLLIVAVLGVNQLKDLIAFSRKWGMEPLVEVHTERETEIALDCGAKVIGVNNRNLHTFQLDLDTTERALNVARRRGITWRHDPSRGINADITVLSLSGVTSAEDVQGFRKLGVSGVLVGETLMKSSNPRQTILDLLSEAPVDASTAAQKSRLLKLCGFTRAIDVQTALQSGINLIGLIFAKSPRTVTDEQVHEITQVVRKYGERTGAVTSLPSEIEKLKADKLSPKLWYQRCADVLRKVTVRQPLTVGVFQDQPIEFINDKVLSLGLDMVQLHGSETPEFARSVNALCVKVIHVPVGSANVDTSSTAADTMRAEIDSFAGSVIAVLLDSKLPGTSGGGTGATFDWSLALAVQRPLLLAGGLGPDNVKSALALDPAIVVGVDASSGVEESAGMKDEAKMKLFASNARS